MALINCRCRATINTARAERNGNDYRCPECGDWTRHVLPPDQIASEAAAARTTLETWACPYCGKRHQFPWGPAGVAGASRIECNCTYLVDDGQEVITEQKWIDGPDGTKVIGLVPRTMRRTHTARRSFTVNELRQQGQHLQTAAFEPIG